MVLAVTKCLRIMFPGVVLLLTRGRETGPAPRGTMGVHRPWRRARGCGLFSRAAVIADTQNKKHDTSRYSSCDTLRRHRQRLDRGRAH